MGSPLTYFLSILVGRNKSVVFTVYMILKISMHKVWQLGGLCFEYLYRTNRVTGQVKVK